MKAIIMAGGEGSRLRPLTCDCPKPMMRLLDRPVMEYALALIRRHGIQEAAVTLGYLPDAIVDHFGNGENWGISLRYFTERVPLGTAGGVKQASEFLDETFCVLSGDGVTDLDLTQALEFHQKNRALATMILKRVENPLEYGVVVTGADGRVRSFLEKPGMGDVISDTVNTGIYILDPEILRRIPEGKPCDFGSELFPQLVREGARVFALPLEGYWCDIGDTGAYLRCSQEVLCGELSLEFPSGIQKGAFVHEDAQVEFPCYIGAGARIDAGATVGQYSVIGQGARVHRGASLKRAILLPGAVLEADAQARMCVVGSGAKMASGAQAYEESVLGTGAELGERSVLLPGVKVWPHKRVEDGERLEANLVWGSRAERGFVGGELPLTDPAQASRAAQALAAALKPGEYLLARTRSAVSSALFHACLAGMMAQGVQLIDAGVCTLPQLRHALATYGADGAALVGGSGLTPISQSGAPLTRNRQRAVQTLLMRQDFSGPFSGITRPVFSAGRTELAYISSLASAFHAEGARIPPTAVYADDPQLLTLAERAFQRAGIRVRCEWEPEMMDLSEEEIGIWLSDTGEFARFSGADGAFSDPENQLLLAWTALELGEKHLLLPVWATRAIEEICKPYAAEAVFESVEQTRWMDRLSREFPLQFRLQFDGIYFALSALSALAQAGRTIEDFRRSLPRVHRKSVEIDMALRERASVLRSLSENEDAAELGGGIRLLRENGWAWICPDEKRPVCRIVSESTDAEFAEELCNFCKKSLVSLMNKP